MRRATKTCAPEDISDRNPQLLFVQKPAPRSLVSSRRCEPDVDLLHVELERTIAPLSKLLAPVFGVRYDSKQRTVCVSAENTREVLPTSMLTGSVDTVAETFEEPGWSGTVNAEYMLMNTGSKTMYQNGCSNGLGFCSDFGL